MVLLSWYVLFLEYPNFSLSVLCKWCCMCHDWVAIFRYFLLSSTFFLLLITEVPRLRLSVEIIFISYLYNLFASFMEMRGTRFLLNQDASLQSLSWGVFFSTKSFFFSILVYQLDRFCRRCLWQWILYCSLLFQSFLLEERSIVYLYGSY